MASVATAKGIRVEQASFEEWQPADRMFDIVVFAQSFHWVEPELALRKVASILRRGGRDLVGIRDIAACRVDPLRRLMEDMWLVP